MQKNLAPAHAPESTGVVVDGSDVQHSAGTPSMQELLEFWAAARDIVSAGRDLAPNVVASRSALEAIHGRYRSRPVEAFGLPLMGKGFAVARIDFKSGMPNCSGFLVKAASLGLPMAGYVVVTVNHGVCDPDKPGATAKLKDSKHPDRMTVRFELRRPEVLYGCEVIWQSPIQELDVSILRLDRQIEHRPRYDFEAESLVLARREPDEWLPLSQGGGRRRQRLYALHHPDGRRLEVSMDDNGYLGQKPRPGTVAPIFLHYRCPTEAGSSGAPVLNEDLEVVAIHRAGSETLHDGEQPVGPISRVNEGVSVQSLRAAIAASLDRFSGTAKRRSGWGWGRW